MEFKIELYTSDEHVLLKKHKLLLRFEMKGEQIKECMIRWVKKVGYNTHIDQRQATMALL